MIEPRFFSEPEPLDLSRLLALTGAAVAGGAEPRLAISGLAALDRAGPSDLALVADADDLADLADSRAGAILISADLAPSAPAGAVALVAADPARAYARIAEALYPAAARPQAVFGPGVAPGAVVHPDARLEPEVTVDPGVVVGPRAEIGRGATLCANAVIGADVRIGRGAVVGHGATVVCALVGDRVVVHAGARIGQGGAGPALGRAILQDDAVVGANATVDRGALADTVIGEGTRVDNLVQIGQDVLVGRRCLILGPAAIAPASVFPDYAVVLDGRDATAPGRAENKRPAPQPAGRDASEDRAP